MTLSNYACKRAYLLDDGFIDFLEKNAVYPGTSVFVDHVFRIAGTNPDLDEELMWVREITKEHWRTMKQGKFYPFHKIDVTWPNGFQRFALSVGDELIECDTLEAAALRLGEVELWFSFSRISIEYQMNDLLIYVEEVQGIPRTIEFVCRTKSLKENMEAIDQFMIEHKLDSTIPHLVAMLVQKVRK